MYTHIFVTFHDMTHVFVVFDIFGDECTHFLVGLVISTVRDVMQGVGKLLLLWGGGGGEGAQREIRLTSSQVRSVQIGQYNAKEGANHMPPGPWPLIPL